ncbi:hypothetical protein [Aquibacillus sediminis]|uniref:hypothetical protein n=1 Tax=Aquibacillus sediminis TaxID=2574734 RepID=UPI0011084F63|nr:hypothetical protein [Aquibacillus sediminis]
MKKLVISIIIGAVILGGATTYVSAQTNGNEWFNFEDMQPYMEQMHPNFSTEQQQQMFNDCHGENGYMQNNDNRFEEQNGMTLGNQQNHRGMMGF